MSVIVIGHMTVDPAVIQKLWRERKADFEAIAADAKAAGAKHHQWGLGDGQAVIIDEWADAESFQKFFTEHPKIADLMQAAGVQAPPTIEILEYGVAPDSF